MSFRPPAVLTSPVSALYLAAFIVLVIVAVRMIPQVQSRVKL